MRARAAVPAALGIWWAGLAWGGYTYDYNCAGTNCHLVGNPPYSGVAVYTGTVSFANPNDYDVAATISVYGTAGPAGIYLRDDSPNGGGNFISLDMDLTNGATSTMSLAVNQTLNGTTTQLGSVQISAQLTQQTNYISLRAVIRGTTLLVYDMNSWLTSPVLLGSWQVTATAGKPGYYYNAGGTTNISVSMSFGHIDTIAPTQIGSNIPISSSSSFIAFKWPATADDANGTGVFRYEVYRNGSLMGYMYPTYGGAAFQTAFVDKTAVPGTQYTYGIDAVDYHGNISTITNVIVTAPPGTSVDPRRPGVRPDGAYWGGGGEQINMQGGNLNFSLSLQSAQGRRGDQHPLGLSYNSQNWRQDNGVNWQIGGDVGYGFGWRMAFGSITPYYANWTAGVDHYVFTDGTGAEYKLNVNTNGVWSSQESLYAWFDANTSILHFKDGTYWVMGCTSGGAEFDAGTMYPTIMEDTFGNQITIGYDSGIGLQNNSEQPPYDVVYNSSSRILAIQDPRTTNIGSTCYVTGFGFGTYCFAYSSRLVASGGQYVLVLPELTSGAGFTFTYTSGAVEPPFGTDANYSGYTVSRLATAVPPAGGAYTFGYDTAGASELSQVTFPTGGYLKWVYSTETYSGGRSLRAVTSRILRMDSSGSNELTYPITRDSVAGTAMHATATLADASGNGAKTWNFLTPGGSTPSWQYGLTSEFLQKTSASGTVYTDDTFTWSQNGGGYPYISTKISVSDPGTANAVTAKITQTQDQFGNLTQMVTYPFNNTTTPLKTYNNTYLTDSTYLGNYIRDRLLISKVTFGSTTKTLVTNYYDGKTQGQSSGPPCASSSNWRPYSSPAITIAMDPNPPLAFAFRGSLSDSVTPAKTTCMMVYSYGALAVTQGSDGSGVSQSADSSTNYAAPQSISSATYSETVGYSGWLDVVSTTGLNGEQLSMTYDGARRPLSATSPFGAMTSFTYTATLPMQQVKTGPDGYTRTTLDGMGRTIKVERGPNSSTIQSVVDTLYTPCACSPLGKLWKTSMPYASGGSASAWTTNAYDGIGRTLTVTQPDGGVTTYSYAGNATTVTDPAGKWKKFTNDVEGNLLTVTEPDPANPATGTLTTNYTYDWMKHLTGVSMPRGSVTQTRTFAYDDAGRLTSATNPENGTVAYYYNTDNTLWYKHDAKGQDAVYTYDTKKRVTKLQRYPTGKSNAEDTCLQVNYTYDAALSGSNYTQNYVNGRLSTVQYTNCVVSTGPVTELYSYHPAGAVTGKRFQFTHAWHDPNSYVDVTNGVDTPNLDLAYTYTSAGLLSSATAPQGWSATAQATTISYNTNYDAMSRPISMSMTYSTAPTCAGNILNLAQGGTYDFAGRLSGFQIVSGVTAWDSNNGCYYVSPYAATATQAQTYNAAGQLATLGWSGTGAPAGTLTYSYTSATQPYSNGQITQVNDGISGETVVYTYDALKRLTAAASTPNVGSSPTAWTETYGYDGFGNLTSKVLNGGNNTVPAIEAATNHIAGVTYDANGNYASGGAYSYDEANRMTQATIGTGNPEKYAYAPDNKRIYRKAADGVTDEITLWGAHGEKVGVYAIGEAPYWNSGGQYWTGGTTLAMGRPSIYFAGRLIWEGNGAVFQDRVGTNRASGARFRPYGDEITSTANDREKFGTYNRDAFTGLDYADQRYYASSYANFTSADPSMDNVDYTNPASWSAYTYTLGDPINANDPSGLDTVTLPPVVPGTNCSTAFINYAAQFGETIQQLFNSDAGVLGVMNYFEQQGSGSKADQQVWAALDWTFLDRWDLSASDKAWFYGPNNIPATFAATVTTGNTRSQVFTSSGQLTAGNTTTLLNILTGSPGSTQCAGLATAFDVAQGTLNAHNNNPIPGLDYITNPVPGALAFGSDGAVPSHSRYVTQTAVGTITDGSHIWTFFSDAYNPPPPIRRPPPGRRKGPL